MSAAPRRERTLPRIDSDSRPFWESCRRHAMALPRCGGCGAFRFPPRRGCPRCGSDATQWMPVAGTGRVYASLVVHQAADRDLPFNLSLVELEEGVRMWGNVVGSDPDAVGIGDRVRVDYEDVTSEVTLPRFMRVA